MAVTFYDIFLKQIDGNESATTDIFSYNLAKSTSDTFIVKEIRKKK